MARLTLTLLGPFTVALDGQSLNLRSARIRALLAYLALEPPRPHRREALAALFWPDELDQAARQNLRQALYQLRGLLGELAEPFLLVASDTVQRNAACDYALDVALFLEHVKQGRASEAVALYQAELLTDLRSDSAPFEEWLALRREQLHILALDALHQLAEQALERGEAAHAQEYARRQLALEPWRELAHRQLMRALAADDRSAALAQFETCRAVLQSEFGAEPEPETSALAEQIRVGTPAQAMTPRSSAQRPHNAQRRDWGDIPEGGTFYGRAHELAQLQHWITGERCRLVAVLGMGGLGKTTLAAQGARHCADHFAVVIWRSLLNAPSLAELLADWLSLLFQRPRRAITSWPTFRRASTRSWPCSSRRCASAAACSCSTTPKTSWRAASAPAPSGPATRTTASCSCGWLKAPTRAACCSPAASSRVCWRA